MLRKPASFMPAKGAPRASAQERVLAQWRGVNLAPRELETKSRARAVGNVLPDVLKSIRFEQRAGETEIVKIWNATIDPTVAAHAQPTGLHNGTLFVTVDNNVWLSDIVRWRRVEILKRIQAAVGMTRIQKISFRVG
ncbi:MAG: DUF721 domain-containing protein [Verrucomicrobia bacterium]|nr:DUF721 domain-containing protein [Verrucomicrobiota bacterium]